MDFRINKSREEVEKSGILLKRVEMVSDAILEGITLGTTLSEKCRVKNRNNIIFNAVEKTNPKVIME